MRTEEGDEMRITILNVEKPGGFTILQANWEVWP